jgi:hypothetical protein
VLDVVLHDDLAHLRSRYGRENMCGTREPPGKPPTSPMSCAEPHEMLSSDASDASPNGLTSRDLARNARSEGAQLC